MASYVAGIRNIAIQYPNARLQSPTTYTVSSGTDIATLGGGTDTTYISQTAATVNGTNRYFIYRCASLAMPTGSRVVYARGVARAYRSGTSKRSFYVALADNQTKSGLTNSAAVSSTLNTSVIQLSGPGQTKLVDGKTTIDQTALTKGLSVLFGEKTSGVTESIAFRTTQAWVEVSYDQPPTVTNVITGTFNDTSSPLLTWDYNDDLQPQAAYQAQVLDSTGTTVVYDSGQMTSSNTFHQMPVSLPNGSYVVRVYVWQAWSGIGGAFRCLSPSTNTITISVLPLPTPVLAATNRPVTLNFLSGDSATFANSLGAWTSGGTGTLAWASGQGQTGLGAAQLTLTSPGGSTYACSMGNTVDLSALTSPVPLALTISVNTGGNADIVSGLSIYTLYYDASMNYLGRGIVQVQQTAAFGNNWFQYLGVDSSFPPATARYCRIQVQVTSSVAGRVVYVDDADLGVYNSDTRLANLNYTSPFAVTLFANNHVNLLDFDDAAFDNGVVGWFVYQGSATIAASNAAVVDGLQAMKVTATGSGTITISQYVGSVNWPYAFPGYMAASIKGPSTVTGKSYAMVLNYYDVNFALLSTSTLTTAPTTASTSYQRYIGNAPNTFPTGTAYVSVAINIYGAASGDVFYIDDVMLSDYIDSTVPWSRGGVITNTPNLLSYDDSTIGPNSNWVAGDTGTTVAISTDYARQGQTSLKMTKITAAGTTNATDNGNSNFISIDPTVYSYSFIASIYSPTTARTVGFNIAWFDVNFASVGTGTYHSFTSVVGAWTSNESTSAAPTGAAYAALSVTVSSAAVNEVHYIDTAAFYPLSTVGQFNARGTIGWQPGQYPNTDAAPVLEFDYQDSEGVWHVLDQVPFLDAETGVFNPILTATDYEIPSGVVRAYRGQITKQQNGTQLTSSYGTTSGVLVLSRSWMHARVDPPDTINQFFYDGAGRSQVVGVNSVSTQMEGRAYPFAEFSTQDNGSLAVTVQLPNTQDQQALMALAGTQGEVVFRDQRGRSVVGVMGPVTFTDEMWGQTGSFTLTLTGSLL